MSNVGNDRTEQILKRLEDNIREQYTKAYKEIVKKLKSYLKQFDDEDVLQHERLDQGLITMADYLDWRRRHILLNKQWEDMRDALALDLHHVNEMAYKIAREQMPEIFAINANHAAYEIERDYEVDTGVKIYNRQAAERLLAKQQRLLPAPSKRKALELWENPDVKWNEKLVQSAVLQGILQGESMDKVAKRLMSVTDMDYRAAIRNARTMTTSAQNAGREEMYRQIDENGTKLTIVWLATLDNRTRHSHRYMHGEVKDGEYYSNGLRYPGDPEGDPAEVYNCRCQERAFIKGMEDIPTHSPKMGDQTFDEWLNGKSLTKEQEQQWIKDGKPPMSEWLESSSYKMVTNASRDAEQFDRYKNVLGNEIPETLAKFQNLKYNDPDQWEYTKGLYRYISKYPTSDKVYYDIGIQLKTLGLEKGVVLPPVQKHAYILPSKDRDPYHIMKRMMERNITDDDIRGYMKNAKCMFVQWGGQRQLFVSEKGAAVINKGKDEEDWIFKTAWKAEDNDEGFEQIIEVLKHAGL